MASSDRPAGFNLPWDEMKTGQQVGYLRSLIRDRLRGILEGEERGNGQAAELIRDLAEAHKNLAGEYLAK